MTAKSEPPYREPMAGLEPTPVKVEDVSTPAVPVQAVPEAFATLWPVFLERLGAKKMSLAAYLADAKPLSLDVGDLTVGLPGFALHHEVLTVADNRRLIEGLLSELAKTRLTVRYTTLPESLKAPADFPSAPAAPASSVSPVVQAIVTLFNATILDRPPRTTP